MSAESNVDLEIRINRYLEFDRINGLYLDWQFEQFKSYVGDRVLEIGCGVGGFLNRLPQCSLIHGLDVESDILEFAQARFKDRPEFQFSLLDLSSCLEDRLSELQQQELDTVLAVNVLEHIQDDVEVVKRIERILSPGGFLLLLVPAHPWLYGEYDRLDGHYRRYSRASLLNLMNQTTMEVVHLRSFNLVGGLGWWLHYRVFKRKIHGRQQFSCMNQMIPLLRVAERVVPPPFGLSLVAVLRKRVEVGRT